jgi:membrane associated rhomboid family serine protease
LKNLWKGTQVLTRMCSSCRALIGVNERSCPFCGESVPRRPSGLGKLLSNFLPHFAPVSYGLLTANFLLFLLMFYSDSSRSVEDIGIFLGGGSPRSLVNWGANVGWLVMQGQLWRLVSAIFIHIGIIHLLFNSYALLFIGPLLEELLGKEKFLVLYLATGVAGYVLSNWYYPPFMPTAGASGAIFGLIGAGVVLSKRWAAWGQALHQQLVHWAIYGFVYGLLLGANNAAHLGGLLAGVGVAMVLPNPNRQTAQHRLWQFLYWLGVAIIVASLSLALLSRFKAHVLPGLS